MHGKHLLKTYARTQNTIALSSAEAELYATVQGASEGLGFAAMAKDFGKVMVPWLYVDASAAIGIAQRKGLGKIRHLDTQSLWVQDAVRTKRVMLEKVLGTENPADMYTKHLDAQNLAKCMRKTGMFAKEGRSSVAPDLVRSEGKNDKLEVEQAVDSLMGDDEVSIVEEQIEECQWQRDEDHSRAQRGTPQLRGGSGEMCDHRPGEWSGSFEQRCSGKPAEVDFGEYPFDSGKLAEARVENEEVSYPASRRRVRRRGPTGQMLSTREGLKFSLEFSTCSSDDRPVKVPRHCFSALSAGGEVQNETPSLYSKQTVACVFIHRVCASAASSIHATARHCTHAIVTPSGNRCVHTRVRVHMHIKDKAPRSKLFVIERAHEYSHSNDGLCCCGGSSA